LVLGGSARLAIPGLLIGAAAAYVAARILSTFLFEVEPRDPLTFLGAGVVLLVVALGAGYAPARRASRIDPLVAIK
jgi:putative ABC transport system permease protein